jgi:hypothetical protein
MSSGTKPFSKLQKRLYNLMDRSNNFQIHCVAYRMPKSQSSNPQIPRYWITVGKGKDLKIIWDFPGAFLDDPHMKYQPYIHIPNISNLISDYCNTPKDELRSKAFEDDEYGLIDILRSFDRRL